MAASMTLLATGQAEPLGPPGARNANGDDGHANILTDANGKAYRCGPPAETTERPDLSPDKRLSTASGDHCFPLTFPSVLFPAQ